MVLNTTFGLLGGLVLAAVVAVFSILAYRRLQAELQREIRQRLQAEARYREGEQRYRHLLEATPFPVMISRMDSGAIRHINPRLSKRLELQADEIIGSNVRQFYVDPAGYEAIVQHLKRGEAVVERELQLRNQNGETFSAVVSATQVEYEYEPAVFTVVKDMTETIQLRAQLDVLTNIDPLTGLTNRRHFLKHLGHEIERARRRQESLALLALDIDDFKRINDIYGHAAGDEVLLTLAQELKALLRGYDFAGRLGSGDFMVALPEAGIGQAVAVAERIRQVLEQTVVLHEDRSLNATISVGVASLEPEESLDQLIRRAGQQLDAARQRGGNRVGYEAPVAVG